MGLGRHKRFVRRVRDTSDTAEAQLSANPRCFPHVDGPQLPVHPVIPGRSGASAAYIPLGRRQFCLRSRRAAPGSAAHLPFSGGGSTGQRTPAEVAMALRDSGAHLVRMDVWHRADSTGVCCLVPGSSIFHRIFRAGNLRISPCGSSCSAPN